MLWPDDKLIFDNDRSSNIESALRQGRYTDAESECKQLLAQHDDSGRPADVIMLTWMKSLAKALEAQGKFSEGLDTRLRARWILMSLMEIA